MADPFSVVASSIAIVTAAVTLSKKTYETLSSIQNTPTHIAVLVESLKSLYVVLGNLQSILEKKAKTSEVDKLPQHLVENTNELLASCMKVFQDVSKTCAPFLGSDGQALRSAWKLFRWEMFGKNDTLILQNALADRRAALNLACECLILHNTERNVDEVRQLQKEIRDLRNEVVQRKHVGSEKVIASEGSVIDPPLDSASYSLPMERFLARTESIISVDTSSELQDGLSASPIRTSMARHGSMGIIDIDPSPPMSELHDEDAEGVATSACDIMLKDTDARSTSDSETYHPHVVRLENGSNGHASKPLLHMTSLRPTSSFSVDGIMRSDRTWMVVDHNVLLKNQDAIKILIERRFVLVVPHSSMLELLRARFQPSGSDDLKCAAADSVLPLIGTAVEQDLVKVLDSSGNDVTKTMFLGPIPSRPIGDEEDDHEQLLTITRQASILSRSSRSDKSPKHGHPAILLTEDKNIRHTAARGGVPALSPGTLKQYFERGVKRIRSRVPSRSSGSTPSAPVAGLRDREVPETDGPVTASAPPASGQLRDEDEPEQPRDTIQAPIATAGNVSAVTDPTTPTAIAALEPNSEPLTPNELPLAPSRSGSQLQDDINNIPAIKKLCSRLINRFKQRRTQDQ